MMRKTRTTTILALLLAATPALATSGTLSLEQAAEEAMQGSPELRKLELAADSASWRKLEALSGHLPHVSVNASHFLAAKYSRLGVFFGGSAVDIPTAFPQTTIDVEVSLRIFDGLQTINYYRAAILNNEAASLDYDHARFRLEREVHGRFYQALAAEELLKVADQNIRTLEDHLQLARARQSAGFDTRVDLLRLESQIEEAKAERILAADNVTIARNALFEKMGIPDDQRALEGTLPVPDPKRIPQNLALDVSERPDVQAQTKRELALDRVNGASAAFWLPAISIFGTQQWYKYNNFDPAIVPNSSFQNDHALGLRLTWNLFDGGMSIARKAQADDAAKQAAETTRQVLLASPHEFEMWKRRYIYNAALFQARQRSVEKSVEGVRLATIGVRAGTKTHSEALDAELDLFRARAGSIRAQVDAADALSNLELALGHSL